MRPLDNTLVHAEAQRFAASVARPRNLYLEVENYYNTNLDQMMHTLHATVYGVRCGDMTTETYTDEEYVSWWQMFKDTTLRRWLRGRAIEDFFFRKFPVRKTYVKKEITFKVYANFPELPVPDHHKWGAPGITFQFARTVNCYSF